MQTLSHKAIALIVAGLSVFLCVFAIVFLDSYQIQNIPLFLLINSIVIFIIVFIITYNITKKYIIQKVKPIYKTIQTAQSTPFKKIVNNENDFINIIEHTEKEVADWAQRKNIEIEELKRLEKYRREYIGNVSHELKTPIFALQGYISTLIDGGIFDENINMVYLEKADKVIQRMTLIVRDLDSITRLETGELQLEYSNFNVIALIKEVFENHEVIANERKVVMGIEMGIEKPVMIRGDKKHIQILFSNLIVNAIKYSNPHNGKVQVKIYDMDNLLLFEIADNGIGIESNHLGRIFERFYRVDTSRSREQGGTGLGLSIVKHIIEAHGQTINVKSTPQKGTSFTFTLEKSLE